ncbi:MAG: trigger factor [Bacilli bacterium]|jgi:trigger factor
MATKLIDKGNAVYEVTASIGGKDWTNAQDKAYAKLAEGVQVKGFRKGKAPLNLAKERISGGQMFEEAMNIVLPKMFSDVVSEHKLNVFYRPDVRPTKVSPTELEVVFTIVCFPEVTLGKYKGINVPLEKVSVSDEDVKEGVDHLREQNAEWVLKTDAPAAKGDTVVMDFKGYVDGKEFEGGSSDNYSLVLGSNSFIPGFEDQLIGAKPESKVDVEVTFPEHYVKELAGKKAKFVCMVHEVKTKKYPEITDDFAKGLNLPGVTDVKTLEKHVKDDINNKKVSQAKDKQFNDILKAIVDDAKVVVAPQVIASETAAVKKDMVNQIQQNGLSFDQYKEITGLNDAQLEEQFQSEAKARLTQFLVLNKIGEVEKLVVAPNEIQDYYANLAKTYGMKVEEVEKALKPQESKLREQLIQGKIEKFVIANNTKEEKPAAKKADSKKTEDKKAAK